MSDSDFDKVIGELQRKSFTEVRQAFGEKGFQRWLHPRYNKVLDQPDGSARVRGSCGDSIEIFLKFSGDRVLEASYATDGCGASSLCGSFTAELAHGKTPGELMGLKPRDVLDAIGTFPDQDRHCATLAVIALHKALHAYLVNKVPEQNWIIQDNSNF